MTLVAGAPEGKDPYVGQAGDTFDLIVTGEAWSMDWDTMEKVLLPAGTLDIDPDFLVDTSGISLASPALYWEEYRSDSGLTLRIVGKGGGGPPKATPEPGTLVLLITGGVGLLASARRRRR